MNTIKLTSPGWLKKYIFSLIKNNRFRKNLSKFESFKNLNKELFERILLKSIISNGLILGVQL